MTLPHNAHQNHAAHGIITALYATLTITTWLIAAITLKTGWALTALTLTTTPIIITWAHQYIHTGHIFGTQTINDPLHHLDNLHLPPLNIDPDTLTIIDVDQFHQQLENLDE